MKQLIKQLMPDYIVASVGIVDFEQLAGRGVKHLVFDVDNTLFDQEPLVMLATTADLLRGLITILSQYYRWVWLRTRTGGHVR